MKQKILDGLDVFLYTYVHLLSFIIFNPVILPVNCLSLRDGVAVAPD